MVNIVEEKDEIRDLMTCDCLFIDSSRYDDWVSCFTEDGVFDSPILGDGKARLHCHNSQKNTEPGLVQRSLDISVMNIFRTYAQ